MDKRSGWVGFGWVWLVRKCNGRVVGGSVDSGCHKLSENIWFVWSKRSYSEDKVGCHGCPRRTTECEDRARILETEFVKRKVLVFTRVYICVKAKLTFFSFFAPFPNDLLWICIDSDFWHGSPGGNQKFSLR